MNAVFVYGLLRPGYSLHHTVEPCVVRSAPGTARGNVYDAQYPGGRFDEDGEVDGVVLWLDDARLDEALQILDEVEDEGEMYDRRVISVATADGPVDAFVYHYLLDVEGLPIRSR